MKALKQGHLLTILLFLPYILFAQNRSEYFLELNPEKITTGILYDMAFPRARIDAYDGTANTRTAGRADWRSIFAAAVPWFYG